MTEDDVVDGAAVDGVGDRKGYHQGWRRGRDVELRAQHQRRARGAHREDGWVLHRRAHARRPHADPGEQRPRRHRQGVHARVPRGRVRLVRLVRRGCRPDGGATQGWRIRFRVCAHPVQVQAHAGDAPDLRGVRHRPRAVRQEGPPQEAVRQDQAGIRRVLLRAERHRRRGRSHRRVPLRRHRQKRRRAIRDVGVLGQPGVVQPPGVDRRRRQGTRRGVVSTERERLQPERAAGR